MIKDYTDQGLVDRRVNMLIRAGFVFVMDIPLTKLASWPVPEFTRVRVLTRVQVIHLLPRMNHSPCKAMSWWFDPQLLPSVYI